MKIAPSSAATNASGRKRPVPSASEVPTSTAAIAAGSVRRRAAITQMRSVLTLRPLRESREVGLALLAVGVPSLLGLLVSVEQEIRVVGELLDARQAVLGRVEARLQQPQRERGHGEHLAAPGHGLGLEALERDDRVDEAHLER